MKAPSRRAQARFWQAFHGWATVGAIGLIFVARWAGWIHSVDFISYISIYALVATHFGAWQGARAEVSSETNPPQADDQG